MSDLANVTLEWQNLDVAFAELEAELTDVARGITVSAWKHILRLSPQWAGRLVVSWTYNIGSPLYEDRSEHAPEMPTYTVGDRQVPIPFQMGSRPAIEVANTLNAGKDKAFKLGDTVYISNGVDHGEGQYAMIAEQLFWKKVHLRYQNLPAQPITYTVDMIGERYSDGVNPAQAGQLRNLAI
jgi:hypothetical protein